MDWFEWARTPEFLLLWKEAFVDATNMLTGVQGHRASKRAYARNNALWVEIREPLDGVRLITLELPTNVLPPRVYLRIWAYSPQGEQLYEGLVSEPYKCQGVPVTRYLDDRPGTSWQRQLDANGVQIKGISHYRDLSDLDAVSQDKIVGSLRNTLESFCSYIETVASDGPSLKAASQVVPNNLVERPSEPPSASEQPANAVSHKAASVQKLESFVSTVQDLLYINEDQRFSQEPPTMKVALANARVGQGSYRQKMLDVWGRRCAMTGCPVEAVLIASHALPWSLCETAKQCLDEYNGLLLSANLDRLFDQGLIAFADDGAVITRREAAIDALVPAERLRFVDPRHVHYLAWHRKHFGFN